MKAQVLGRGYDRSTLLKATLIVASLAVVMFTMIVGSPHAAGTFAPTVTLETSTTRATSHPDARITIDNSASDENIKTLSMSLPPGFWGSLAAATKCTYQNAQADNCSSTSQIGSVFTTAKIDDSDGVLRGKVYLTEACGGAGGDPVACSTNAANDPAGITIIVPAKVGGVDLGNVIVNARVMAQYMGVTPANGILPPVVGVKTVVACASPALVKDCIPDTITDSHGRTVTFTPKKLRIDLISKTTGVPLLTNPSKCSTTQLTTSMGSYDGSTATPSADYTVTGCNTVNFQPSSMTNTEYAPTASTGSTTSRTGLHTIINFPANSASVNRVQFTLPRGIKIDTGTTVGLGTSFDQCPATSVAQTGTYAVFSDVGCPAQAQVGTALITTPLLPDPVKARVYVISNGAVPNIGIIADPSQTGNPKGITISMYGSGQATQIDSTCASGDSPFECVLALNVDFKTLPDAPVSSIDLKLGTPAHADLNRGSLGDNFLQTQVENSPECVDQSDFAASLTSNAGSTTVAGAVSPFSLTGCTTARETTIDAGPTDVAGGYTTDTTPTFTWTTSQTGTFCTIDKASNVDPSGDPNCDGTGTFTSPSALSVGLHRFYIGAGSGTQSENRAFAVTKPVGDTTAPATPNITSGPTSGTTSDTTPTWDFTDAESTSFQCSIDSGAFLPCGSGSASGTFTVAAADHFWAGSDHTFAVRAMDAAGNLSGNATGSFSVEIDFNPVSAYWLSTDAARQHPDYDLTITNDSHEDIRDFSYKLPDGLFGGLTGVKSLCSFDAAAAGDCTSDSQVGTVDTEALVDESVVRVSGQVYLTDPAPGSGDPAGISIKIPAKIQDVNLGDVIVPARLKVREHARGHIDGIDTLAIDLPKEIEPDDTINPWDTTTEIDLKKMVLHLRNNNAASQPLLTNPSDCSPSAFVADFTGYDASTVNQSQSWHATGCDQLGFNPSIQASLIDPSTGKFPEASTPVHLVAGRFTTTLNTSPGDANIDHASVLLPLPVTINVAKLGPVCSIADFNADTCPANTSYGSVSAVTPLLAKPLKGEVYLLKQAASLPALYLRLRGPIAVDVVGHTSFQNVSQILTTFDDLPDAPLTSLSLQVDNVISTRSNACEFKPDQWNMTGTFNANATNGKASSFGLPLDITCPLARYTAKFKAKAKKTTLSIEAIAQGRGGKLKKLLAGLPKGVKINKKALAKRVTVKGDGKKLKAKCFKATKKNTVLELGLCKKQYDKITIKFASGSLTAPKKVKKPKLKMTGYNTSGQKQTAIVDYFG